MYILGVYYGHNATVSLIKDGMILACASEERFTGIKNQDGFPKQAIDYVLKRAKISSRDLDLVTLSHKYGTPIYTLIAAKRNLSIRLFIFLYTPINLYQVLKEFERLTGVGGVLNTSFNLHGYPIVLGPREAVVAFENSGLKYLTLENYLISKK